MGLEETWWLFPVAAALVALVAVVGYWLGRFRPRHVSHHGADNPSDIDRALSVVEDLEGVARRLKKALGQQGRAVRKFSTQLDHYEQQPAVSWQELCDRADEMLKPAMRWTADISQAYTELLQQMTHLSRFAELRSDPLTGAANRLALDETLGVMLAGQTRHDMPLALAMVDIDYFKHLNEKLSVLEGDRVLKDLAEVLRAALRQCDVLARYGGEEFVIVMPHTGSCVAAELAERVRNTVRKQLPITVSIGLALSAHGDTPATLFGRADAALTQAKAAGRNCVYLHETATGRVVGIKEQPGNGVLSSVGRPALPPVKAAISIVKSPLPAHAKPVLVDNGSADRDLADDPASTICASASS